MNAPILRSASIADAEYIALLGRATFTETFGNYFRDPNDLITYYDRTFTVKKIRASIAKPNTRYWLAFVNELPVAYAKLKLDSSSEFSYSNNTCQLQKIYVLKDFHSQKIGYGLQNTLLKKACELKKDSIWLSVLKENIRAIRFYEQNNFSTVGHHKFQIGKENFEFTVMEKELKEEALG